MPYSRSSRYEKQRSRRKSRLVKLAVLNVVFIGVLATGVWFVYGWSTNGGERPSASSPPSASTPPATATDSSESAPASASPEPSASGSPSSNENAGTIRLAFVGDILPAASVAKLMEKNGYDYPYRKARHLLESADITAGNLESPITDRGTPEDNKQYLFRGPAEALPALKEAGFDVLSLANNHTLDYGWVGLQDTMDALDDHKLKHMGSGNDDTEAFTPVYVESKGMTVAYIGVSRVLPEVSWKADSNHPGIAEAYDPTRAEAAIRDASANADIVIVMVHWGKERADVPNAEQKNLGHRFIDAGADLVIGSHPHVLQGFESYNGKWIAYSLGNFVFNMTATPKTRDTGVLTAACTKNGDCSLELHPMIAVESQPTPMTEEAGKALLKRLSEVSTAAFIEENGTLVEKR